MRLLLALSLSLFLSGCSLFQRGDEFSAPTKAGQVSAEGNRQSTVEECPACYVAESPLKKKLNQQLKPIAKDVRAGASAVAEPFWWAFMYMAYIASGFQPLL